MTTPTENLATSKALLQLRSQVNALWPSRNKASDGLGASAAHMANAAAQGRTDDHASGLAFDITADVSIPMSVLADALFDDPRTNYVIWNKRIRSKIVSPGVWRTYTGENPHITHLHVSVFPAKKDDVADWILPRDGGGGAEGAGPVSRPFDGAMGGNRLAIGVGLGLFALFLFVLSQRQDTG